MKTYLLSKKQTPLFLLILGIICYGIGLLLWWVLQIEESQSELMEQLNMLMDRSPLPFEIMLVTIWAYICLIGHIIEEFAFRVWTKGKTWAYILSIWLSVAFVYFTFYKIGWAIAAGVILGSSFFFVKTPRIKTWFSIIASSVVFVLLHIMNFSEGKAICCGMIQIFGLSLILCYLGLRFRFIFCILLHCINNTIAMLMMWFGVVQNQPDIMFENTTYQAVFSSQPLREDKNICGFGDTLYFSGTESGIAAEIPGFSNQYIYKPVHHTFLTRSYLKVFPQNGMQIDKQQLFNDFVQQVNLQCDTTYVSAWLLDVQDTTKFNNYRPQGKAHSFMLWNQVEMVRKCTNYPIKLVQENLKDSFMYISRDSLVVISFTNDLSLKKNVSMLKPYGIHVYEDTTQKIGIIKIQKKL